MSQYLTNALFCLTGLSAGAALGWILRVLIAEANQRLDQHTQEPQ